MSKNKEDIEILNNTIQACLKESRYHFEEYKKLKEKIAKMIRDENNEWIEIVKTQRENMKYIIDIHVFNEINKN